jgi:hypothetical protein
MNRLIRQLKREMKARPGKAALLGVLALVAAAVGLPRLLAMFKSESAPPSPPPAEAAAVSAPGQPPLGPELSWQELAALVEQLPAMRPALAQTTTGRDPFARLTAAGELHGEEPPAEQPAVEAGPAELGLKLTSTSIGWRGSLAVISGKVYQRGEQVPAAQDVFFELVEIHREHVVLSRGNRTYELRLARGTQSGNVSMRPAP